MMWRKWRIYDREEHDSRLAKSPSTWRFFHWKKKDVDVDTKEIIAKKKKIQKDVI